MFIETASPTTQNESYFAEVNNTSPTRDDTFNVWAICATASVSGEPFGK